MAGNEHRKLLGIGPFKSINPTTEDDLLPEGVGVSGPNTNPFVAPEYALTPEYGRQNITQITNIGLNATITAIAPYVPQTSPPYTDEQIYGCTSSNSRFVYSLAEQTQMLVLFAGVADATAFTQAVQYGYVIYDNGGHQYSSLNPSQTYLWQYLAPAYGTHVALVPVGSGSITAGTYIYAFTNVVTDANGAFMQETTPVGALPNSAGVYPYTVTTATTNQFQINIYGSGTTFYGTNPDGSTFTTNVYRQSFNQPVWYLVTNINSSSPGGATFYNYDDTPDSAITGNAQLVLNRDAPPCTNTNPGVIFVHKDRMWVFIVVQNAATNNLPQCQLWYSNYGRPWEFNAVYQVLLVGTSAITGAPAVYEGPYGDYPQNGISFSSVAILFRRKSIWIVYGDDPVSNPFTPRKLFDIGCMAKYSVVSGTDGTNPKFFWLSEKGVYMSDGTSATYISEEIRAVIDGLTNVDRNNAVGMFRGQTYFISFPVSNQTWAYHTTTGEWYGPLPYGTYAAFSNPTNPTSYNNVSGIGEVVAVRLNTAYLDNWFTSLNTDLGNPVTFGWTGPLTNSGMPENEKEYTHIVVNAPIQPGVLATVTLTVDPGSNPPKVYTWTFDLGKGSSTIGTIPKNFRGYLAQVSVQVVT